jgi:hypothetical protein
VPSRTYLRIEGLPQTRRMLTDVGDRGRRPEPALRSRATLDLLTRGEAEQFASGQGWPRENRAWASEKRRRGLDPRVMRATGRLERALTRGGGAGLTHTAYDGVMRFGIPRGRSDIYYAQALAKRRRRRYRSVVIRPATRDAIAFVVLRYIDVGAV